mmetsp:Transcript_6213/g.25230  ORF Transcript_6213/g.25230 Transcript_6213/m.25230 type:complete len:227 (+) Transcript_6213:390-1070(+)
MAAALDFTSDSFALHSASFLAILSPPATRDISGEDSANSALKRASVMASFASCDSIFSFRIVSLASESCASRMPFSSITSVCKDAGVATGGDWKAIIAGAIFSEVVINWPVKSGLAAFCGVVNCSLSCRCCCAIASTSASFSESCSMSSSMRELALFCVASTCFSAATRACSSSLTCCLCLATSSCSLFATRAPSSVTAAVVSPRSASADLRRLSRSLTSAVASAS